MSRENFRSSPSALSSRRKYSAEPDPWAQGRNGALVDRQILVGDQQVRVDLELDAQTGALGAGTER